MSNEAIYVPVRLQRCLTELAPRFFLPAEFPERPPDKRLISVPDSNKELTGRALRDYALKLKSKVVESLILLLPEADENTTDFILQVLAVRANRRILELYWPFFQYHFRNPAVLEGARILLGQLPAGDRTAMPYSKLALFTAENGFTVLIDALNAHTIPLSLFMTRENLLPDSPLTVRLTEEYFYGCKKEGYLLNEKRLLHIFEITEPASADKILINYLACLDRTEYMTDVNTYILERWGEPAESALWSVIPPELQSKFSDWISYSRLKEHFSRNKLKLQILNSYIPYIRQISLRHDGRYMAADFGEFVIVDDHELSAYSYLFTKSLYNELADSLEKFSVEYVKLTKDRITAARDFIIEEAEDSFMQLDYEDLGKLYIKDTLDILLKLTPDLRPSKSLIRKKRRKKGLHQESL